MSSFPGRFPTGLIIKVSLSLSLINGETGTASHCSQRVNKLSYTAYIVNHVHECLGILNSVYSCFQCISLFEEKTLKNRKVKKK